MTAAPTRRSLRGQGSPRPIPVPSADSAASGSDAATPVTAVPLTRAEFRRRRAAAAAEVRNNDPAPHAEGGAIRDEFEAAAELFASTAETPIQVAAAARDAADRHAAARDAAAAALVGSDREPGPEYRSRPGASFFRRAMAASASLGAMTVAGLVAVGMTTPAEAVSAPQGGAPGIAFGAATGSAVSAEEIQAYVAPADAQSAGFDRSDYRTASTAELAAESGISRFSRFFTNNPNSPIQWPFSVGVPISYGYGIRDGAMHEGLDFTPGNGAQIQAVADGTVRTATESGGGYGVMIIIDHVIDGERVSTRYGHMQYGSLMVQAGDTVKVGQIIGLVGDTGHSFGAHLHFEVLEGGTTAIDPLPWLRLHAGG